MLTIYYNPINYLPYPFAAILVSRLTDKQLSKMKSFYLVLGGLFVCIMFAMLDWTLYVEKGFFTVSTYAIPQYSRPSLVMMAMIVLFLAIRIKLRSNYLILFMSRYSLALYCIHPFFVPVAKVLSKGVYVISLLMTLLLSYMMATILLRFLQPNLIK